MAKGSEFEREFCKDLSLWWTDQERDDIFWRSSNSGGRATVRAKVGRTTAGQYGDVAAIDFDGLPLLELMTMELKRGYSKNTIQDLVDKKDSAAVQVWEKWIHQTITSATLAGSKSWLMVVRRDRRDTIVFFPTQFYEFLKTKTCFQNQPVPLLRLQTKIKPEDKTECSSFNISNDSVVCDCVLMRWENWKRGIKPSILRKLTEKESVK